MKCIETATNSPTRVMLEVRSNNVSHWNDWRQRRNGGEGDHRTEVYKKIEDTVTRDLRSTKFGKQVHILRYRARTAD